MSGYELAHAYETVNLLRKEGAAKIELNRPEALNAWNSQFGADLRDAVDRVGLDDEVRAVMITGAGRAFSSGADLKDMNGREELTPNGRPDVYKTLTQRYHPIMTGLRTMPKPVIAAVNGPAVGIGLSLALASDLVLAKESAYFLLAFVNIGLVPDGGSSVFVPNRVGFVRAMEMAMLGEKIPAPQALDWGLINRVYADDDFDAEVEAFVDRMASGPTKSYAATKRQVNAWMLRGWQDQLELEAQTQREMAASDDFMEGVLSFIQKRDASFKGS
jgi:2-(1,2-epoxy-1,2-dihydrophenyl)acetyl-CoA isomerase